MLGRPRSLGAGFVLSFGGVAFFGAGFFAAFGAGLALAGGGAPSVPITFQLPPLRGTLPLIGEALGVFTVGAVFLVGAICVFGVSSFVDFKPI